MRLDYPPMDINPVFPGLGVIIIIITIIIIIIIIIIENVEYGENLEFSSQVEISTGYTEMKFLHVIAMSF